MALTPKTKLCAKIFTMLLKKAKLTWRLILITEKSPILKIFDILNYKFNKMLCHD